MPRGPNPALGDYTPQVDRKNYKLTCNQGDKTAFYPTQGDSHHGRPGVIPRKNTWGPHLRQFCADFSGQTLTKSASTRLRIYPWDAWTGMGSQWGTYLSISTLDCYGFVIKREDCEWVVDTMLARCGDRHAMMKDKCVEMFWRAGEAQRGT